MSGHTMLSVPNIMRCHPCFDEQAHERVGRVHLPVAPRCNIQCLFCEHKICANLKVQHPGWAQRLLTPADALELVRRLVEQQMDSAADGADRADVGRGFVVGVAGPGEPLANEETFQALTQVHAAFPRLMKCVSTNGLLLERELPRLLDAGVSSLTVTVNALDSKVGQHIYAWVRYQGVVYRGPDAAELLIATQMRGIRAALDTGLAVKVNSVLIPGVNDRHLSRLARRLRDLGVHLMNIMPLIPGGQMRELVAPTCDELRQVRLQCEQEIPQFRKCEQCRADVIRFPRGQLQRSTL